MLNLKGSIVSVRMLTNISEELIRVDLKVQHG